MIVAIDGPAGSGKSTVARALSDRLGLIFLDTGAMYRSVTVECLRKGIDINDTESVIQVARTIRITFGNSDHGQTVFANGVNVTTEIRTPEVDKNVSSVAAIPEVRDAMVTLQRRAGENGDVVAEGRDIGTVVFPNADVKVFLTADPAARAHRRAVQRQGGDAATGNDKQIDSEREKKILADIKARDKADSERKTAPLRAAKDAHHIDSSSLTVEEVIAQIISLNPGLGKRDVRNHRSSRQGQSNSKNASSDDEKSHTESSQLVEEKSSSKNTNESKKSRHLHPFRGNSFDDYYDTALKDFPAPAKFFKWIVVFVLGLVTKIWFRWRWDKDDLFVGDRTPRVLIMNHPTFLDPIVTVIHLYAHGIPVRTIYKSGFNKFLPLAWALSRLGGIPVERGTADMKAIRRATAALSRGEMLLIYPEGTRVKSNTERGEIHGGFSLIAQLAKVDVQPLAIIGAIDIKKKGSLLIKPVKVYLRAGKRISFSELSSTKRKDQAYEMEELGMKRVYELRDALLKEHPGRN